MQWCVTPTLTTAAFTTLTEQAEEQPYSKFKTIGGSNVSFNRIKHYMSTNKILGVPRVYGEANPNLRSAVTTNPSELWYWIITAAAGDLTSSVTQMCQVKLTYYVEFYNRNRPSQS